VCEHEKFETWKGQRCSKNSANQIRSIVEAQLERFLPRIAAKAKIPLVPKKTLHKSHTGSGLCLLNVVDSKESERGIERV
jgi:hypothetical protein